MSSWLRSRGASGTICCWLLVVCLAAISGATPLLAATDLAVDAADRHHALPAGDPASPSAPGGSTAAAIDDLSGPEATAVFRLFSPLAQHHGAPHAPAPRPRTRAHARPAERGPPAGLS